MKEKGEQRLWNIFQGRLMVVTPGFEPGREGSNPSPGSLNAT